jgi:hypothetical protein
VDRPSRLPDPRDGRHGACEVALCDPDLDAHRRARARTRRPSSRPRLRPSVYACYRFATKLRPYSDKLDACIARVLSSLKACEPEMGDDVSIDASDLPAYANGQRYVSKHGPKRKRFADPDASWGHRSAVSTRRGGGFYGYRLHAAVCSRTGLPVAWAVETAGRTSRLSPPR